jgi:hypothetical protein
MIAVMRTSLSAAAFVTLLSATSALAQAPTQAPAMPAEYSAALKTLGKQGDFKDNVLKVNIPRNDLKVTVDGVATPTPLGFGGWVAFTKGTGGQDVMMGDLVVTEAEVNPVMSAVLDNGLEVTALHNHFLFDTPRIFYMHVHGHGPTADLAKRIQPAIALIGKGAAPAGGPAGRTITGNLDTQALARAIGTTGEQNGGVYKITIGRSDLAIKEMGATINARMGLNTWAAFYGSNTDAVVAGDVAMLAGEVQPVLKALRSNGIDVVAIHHHMIGTSPEVYFLHYWGKGQAAKLAQGVKAAVDQLGKGRAGR